MAHKGGLERTLIGYLDAQVIDGLPGAGRRLATAPFGLRAANRDAAQRCDDEA
jgi:hypothetical protein